MSDLNIFALPTELKSSQLVLIPVPWDVTTSYGGGTSEGPELIFQASGQVDLYDLETQEAWRKGYYMLEIPQDLKDQNKSLRKKALPVMATLNEGGILKPAHQKTQEEINSACDKMCDWVYETTTKYLKQNKVVGVVGGDHSVPYGAIKAIGENLKGNFGILHIDAHLDLRNTYHGFKHSHASIMYNVSKLKHKPQNITQFGIRDFCKEEFDLVKSNPNLYNCYFDIETKQRQLQGTPWAQICQEAISRMPDNIYVSFDIDGLTPTLCPDTGTPVPGGLEFQEMLMLLSTIQKLKKQIVGFDLVEVSGGPSNNEWNGNVGARTLFKLCAWTVLTNK